MPSRWLPVPLVVLLPLVGRAGLALARAATGDERLARFLAPAAALAAWVLGIHVVGLATHSFYAGLFAGTLLPAALGAWLWRAPPAPAAPGERTSAWLWVGMLAAVAVMVGPEIYYSKHDECLVTGHVSLPAEMQNGVYPPRHLAFPSYELRYHYATDLVTAAVSSLLGRAAIQPTVHVLTLVLWAYCFCLCWQLGERLVGGRASGPVTAACVLFAGGAPFSCQPVAPLVDHLRSLCKVGGTWITPPFGSNFVQHPWSLGMPLFAALLLFTTRRGRADVAPWGWVLLSVLAAALSLSQAVLFVCLVPALVVAGSLEGGRISLRALGRFLAWAAAMAVAARLLHGFFAPTAEPSEGKIELHPFWLDVSASGWALWNLQALGALLPLGVLGLFFVRAQRVLLGLLAAGGLVVRNLFRYSLSWDIVKFSMVSQVALALLAAAALSTALSRRGWRVAGAAGLGACTFFGLAWPLSLTWTHPPQAFLLVRGAHDCLPAEPAGADRDAIAFLRDRVQAGEGVFRSRGADAYAVYGGLPQPSTDWGVRAFGFGKALYEARRRMMELPDDPGVYLAQGFRWVVLGPEDGARAAEMARQWVNDGRAELAAQFPPLGVYRLGGAAQPNW
jgi:hypothetical protein